MKRGEEVRENENLLNVSSGQQEVDSRLIGFAVDLSSPIKRSP